MLNFGNLKTIIKFLITLLLSSLFINTSSYFIILITSIFTKESTPRFNQWFENIFLYSIVIFCIICIGILLKIIFPPLRKAAYYFRWALLFSLFPILFYGPYLHINSNSFIHILSLIILFFINGFLIGYFDIRNSK